MDSWIETFLVDPELLYKLKAGGGGAGDVPLLLLQHSCHHHTPVRQFSIHSHISALSNIN